MKDLTLLGSCTVCESISADLESSLTTITPPSSIRLSKICFFQDTLLSCRPAITLPLKIRIAELK
ncbi:hypothetical protein C0991_010385, partial [Blastosporella zonata]